MTLGKSIYFSTNPSLNLIFFLILMSTYYNKSNLKVKESSEQYLIEMSIFERCECPILFIPLKIQKWVVASPKQNSGGF